MMRILIVKFWALGDILMATPILRGLKRLYPDCKIDWLVDTYYAGALDGNPLISDVLAFDSGPWRKDYRYGRWVNYLRTSIDIHRKLRIKNYDFVITLTPDKWWTLWFKVGKKNIGLFPSAKSGFLGKFYDIVLTRPKGAERHNSVHYLETVRALGATGELDIRMVCGSKVNDRAALDAFLGSAKSAAELKQIIVIHPGTSQSSKCWPLEYFTELIDLLGDQFTFVITGSNSEIDLAQKIAGRVRTNAAVLIAAGQLSTLSQTTALIERALAVVTGDTSILHIASATGTPLVAIYGSTRPGANEPLFGVRELLFDDSVKCAPCYRATCRFSGPEYLICQRAITPRRVADSIIRITSTVVCP